MKLIFIHGPPAVGKLTVARELSKSTKYKTFHNHLTLDLVGAIFNSDELIFWELVNKFRLEIFKTVAKSNLRGMIFTYGDITSNNFEFVKKVIKVVEKYKGKVCLVHLFCNEKELFKRAMNTSRKKFGKTTNIKKLKENLGKWDFHTVFPNKSTLQIDNINLSAKQVANKIKNHYKL